MRKANAVDGTALLHWVELTLPDAPWKELEPFVGLVFLDPDAGLSARGGRAGDPTSATEPTLTVRLPIGVPGRVIPDDEAAGRGLKSTPEGLPTWLEAFGPQPPRDAPWRVAPDLRGRFHARWPDDLQVLITDAGEEINPGEVCWVRVLTAEGGGVYTGQLLHPTRDIKGVAAGDVIRFRMEPGSRHPRNLR